MTNNEVRKNSKQRRAKRHLESATNYLQFLRKEYLKVVRERNLFMVEDIETIKNDMKETKERIAMLQRLAF